MPTEDINLEEPYTDAPEVDTQASESEKLGGGFITCSCCGQMIRDNAIENRHYGKVPYPDDTGFGMCRGCGGDPKAESVKKKLGWAMCAFYEARFPVIRKKLVEIEEAKPVAERKGIVEKWDNMAYLKRCGVVVRFVEKGWMI